jgi:hypothetical protein
VSNSPWLPLKKSPKAGARWCRRFCWSWSGVWGRCRWWQMLWLSDKLLWNHSKFLLQMQRISLHMFWHAFTGFTAYSQGLAEININWLTAEDDIWCDDRLFLWFAFEQLRIHWKISRIRIKIQVSDHPFDSYQTLHTSDKLSHHLYQHIESDRCMSSPHLNSKITRIREWSSICLSKCKVRRKRKTSTTELSFDIPSGNISQCWLKMWTRWCMER